MALVDIVATLTAAQHQGVIDEAHCELLEALAERLFYKERDYDTLLHAAEANGCSPVTLGKLGQWLEKGRISQKAIDAQEALERVAGIWASSIPNSAPIFGSRIPPPGSVSKPSRTRTREVTSECAMTVLQLSPSQRRLNLSP